MATLSDAIHQVVILSERLGGSYQHQEQRRQLVAAFLKFCRTVGALQQDVRNIPDWALFAYAQYCHAQQMSAGHLANIFSAIRVIFKAAGNDIDGACSNRELKLPRRSRKGTHRAQTPDEVDLRLQCASKLDEGLWHAINLALMCGLRMKETLMCPRDLQMWRDAIAGGSTVVPLLRGAKNGRPRNVEILEAWRAETLAAVDAALKYCEHRNYELIAGRGGDLASALGRFKAIVRRAGMTGQLSFHSLRYTYALRLATQLLDADISPYETLIRVSNALGHGNRARMVLNVYCRPIGDRFAGCLQGLKAESTLGRHAPKVPRARARIESKLRHAALSGHPVGRIGTGPAPRVPRRKRGVHQRTDNVGYDEARHAAAREAESKSDLASPKPDKAQ